jgi:hypothetical protein
MTQRPHSRSHTESSSPIDYNMVTLTPQKNNKKDKH